MNKQLREAIEELIRAKEREVGIKLTIENFDFLGHTCIRYVNLNIDKFIRGAAEHGDNFLTDVDHITELRKEIVDMSNYLEAAIMKMKKFDIRYQ